MIADYFHELGDKFREFKLFREFWLLALLPQVSRTVTSARNVDVCQSHVGMDWKDEFHLLKF